MGCCCSADELEPTLGEHSDLPNDVSPYIGPVLQYAFVDMKPLVPTAGLNGNMDLAPHYAAVEEPYSQGFRVVGLKTVPGVYVTLQAAFVRSMGSPTAPVGEVKIVQTAVEFHESVSTQNKVKAVSEVAHLKEFDAQIEANGQEGFHFYVNSALHG